MTETEVQAAVPKHEMRPRHERHPAAMTAPAATTAPEATTAPAKTLPKTASPLPLIGLLGLLSLTLAAGLSALRRREES